MDLVTIPSSTSLFANIGITSAPWFTEFLPFIYFSLGIFIGISLLIFMISTIKNGIFLLVDYKNLKEEGFRGSFNNYLDRYR